MGFRIEADLTDPAVCEGNLLNLVVNIDNPAFGDQYVANPSFPGEYYAGGETYTGLDAALNRGGAGRAPVVNLLRPQDQVTFLPGTPDKSFERLLMTWLLGLICGALCQFG